MSADQKGALSVIVAVLFCLALILGLMWFIGSAKSGWLRETQGINLSWSECVMLELDSVYPEGNK